MYITIITDYDNKADDYNITLSIKKIVQTIKIILR